MATIITIGESEYGGFWAHVQSTGLDALGRNEVTCNDVISTKETDPAQARQILKERAAQGTVRRVDLPAGYYRVWTDEGSGEIVKTRTQDLFVLDEAEATPEELAQIALSVTPEENLRREDLRREDVRQKERSAPELTGPGQEQEAQGEPVSGQEVPASPLLAAPLNPNGLAE